MNAPQTTPTNGNPAPAVGMTPQVALAPLPPAPVVKMGMDTIAGFEAIQRAAKMLASSEMVPDAYRASKVAEKTAIGNCVIALDIAIRLEMSPMLIMQNLVPVNGKIGWLGQFCIGIVNNSDLFDTLDFEWKGEEGSNEWGCRAFARDRRADKVRFGAWITLKMVKAEGWYSKISREGKETSKWQTMPEQMFVYRAASFWLRQWAPHLLMGIPTSDEVADISEPPPQVSPLRPPPPAPETVIEAEATPGEPTDPDERRAEREAHWMREIASVAIDDQAEARLKAMMAPIEADFGKNPPEPLSRAWGERLRAARAAKSPAPAPASAASSTASPAPQPAAASAPPVATSPDPPKSAPVDSKTTAFLARMEHTAATPAALEYLRQCAERDFDGRIPEVIEKALSAKEAEAAKGKALSDQANRPAAPAEPAPPPATTKAPKTPRKIKIEFSRPAEAAPAPAAPNLRLAPSPPPEPDEAEYERLLRASRSPAERREVAGKYVVSGLDGEAIDRLNGIFRLLEEQPPPPSEGDDQDDDT